MQTITKEHIANALKNTRTLAGRNLSGLDLSGLDLRGVNMASANLTGADLQDVDWSDAILYGANLTDFEPAASHAILMAVVRWVSRGL